MSSETDPLKIFFYTLFALTAFASNSIFCRLALSEGSIDAASFTAIRLISGAAALVMISYLSRKKISAPSRKWRSAAMLFFYAAAFSFAYTRLTAGTGALILFGAVQATMLIFALYSGEKPRAGEWVGLLLALSGLVYLASPGLSAPSPIGFVLMMIAGVSWGVYSLIGRRSSDPLADTTGNFLFSAPFALLVALFFIGKSDLSAKGVLLAASSGALASGLGYVAWYAALRGLASTRAAAVQLTVPVLTGIAGVVLLSEHISIRLLFSSVMILGGVGLAVHGGLRQRTDDRGRMTDDR
ncbi:MAG: DMT family transporter [Desulfobacteraceae bacterium]|nr:MAG: DMT family transporter [Desulfobacteraceae bacterium]